MSTRRQLLLAASTMAGLASFRTSAASASRQTDSKAHEALLSLARYIPASLAASKIADGAEIAMFADLQARCTAVGLDFPPDLEDPEFQDSVFDITRGLPVDSLVADALFDPDAEDLLGWSFVDIWQSLSTFGPDGPMRIFRGGFDPMRVRATWLANGYEQIEERGYEIASLSPEPDFDLTTSLGRLSLGSLNNGYLGDDGTLVFSGSLVGLVGMLDANAGVQPSFADDPGLRSLVASAANSFSGASMLPATAIGASDDASSSLLALAGFISGSSLPEEGTVAPGSGSKMHLAVAYPSAEGARAAAQRATMLLATGSAPSTGDPYRMLFGGWSIDVDEADGILIMQFDLLEREQLWLDLVYRRDIAFL